MKRTNFLCLVFIVVLILIFGLTITKTINPLLSIAMNIADIAWLGWFTRGDEKYLNQMDKLWESRAACRLRRREQRRDVRIKKKIGKLQRREQKLMETINDEIKQAAYMRNRKNQTWLNVGK